MSEVFGFSSLTVNRLLGNLQQIQMCLTERQIIYFLRDSGIVSSSLFGCDIVDATDCKAPAF